jgi:hypothetical protein
MKRFSEQLKKQADSIRLTQSERADVRDRLTAYMEYHPLPVAMRTTEKKSAVRTPLTSQPFIAIPVNWFYVRGAAAAFTLMMVVAVPVMAEYTTPGDVLYPVKVRFNEEVRSGLTVNPYEKIEWETERLERRIAEARLLASEGRLTNELEVVVATAVKEHSDSAKAQIAALRETDKDDAAIAEIAFATALTVQSEVLDKTMAMKRADEVARGDEHSSTEGSVLASVVAEETSEAEASQAATAPSYPKLMARVEVETTAAFELFTSVKNQASPEEVVDIERRLEDVNRKVAMAVRSHEAAFTPSAPAESVTSTPVAETEAVTDDAVPEVAVAEVLTDASTTEVVAEAVAEPVVVAETVLSEADAVEMLRGVMVDLRKLISFMTDIDVRQVVSVEELVPITLTPEEHQSQMMIDLETIASFTALHGETTFSGQGAEKLTLGVADVVRLQTEAEAAIKAGDPVTAEGSVAAALILVGDLTSMIATLGATAAPDVAPEMPIAE